MTLRVVEAGTLRSLDSVALARIDRLTPPTASAEGPVSRGNPNNPVDAVMAFRTGTYRITVSAPGFVSAQTTADVQPINGCVPSVPVVVTLRPTP
ncbi:MAG: hypothetical protein MUF00_04660 [Gemmatimonadaceae bacterium]|nr:hypothetical protein [Gemmatimonadaceae bacterium]